MELISRKELLEKIENKEIVRLDKNGLCDIDEVLSIVRYGVPTVDAVPVVHGEWEISDIEHAYGKKCYRCSECEHEEWRYEKTRYCPNCGAKMIGGAP